MSLCSVFLDNEGFCPQFHLQIRCWFFLCVIWVKHSFKMKPLLDCQTIPQTFQLQIPFWCWNWEGCIQQWGVFLVAFTARTWQKLPVQRGTTGIKYIFIFQLDGLLGWMNVSAGFAVDVDASYKCQLIGLWIAWFFFYFLFFLPSRILRSNLRGCWVFFWRFGLSTDDPGSHPVGIWRPENKSQESTLSHIIALKAIWKRSESVGLGFLLMFYTFCHIL